MEALKLYFQKLGFADESLAKIVSAFKPKEIKKGEYFVELNKQSRYLAFIETGMFQYYVIVEDEEKTTYIAIENSFLASLLSFLNEIPAKENIRAITNAVVWQIDKIQLQNLLQEVIGFKDFYIKLLEYQISCIDKSRFDLLMLSSEQRYEKMLVEEPHLLQKIPLQYLASMLGITPRHLSRIRKNIS
jgi:CRP-like cAMP-binding protein